MKATEQYFPVVLFIMLYKVALTFESLGEILKCAMQLKATEQYFPLVFLRVVQKMVLIFCTWIIYTKPFLVRCELSVSSKW